MSSPQTSWNSSGREYDHAYERFLERTTFLLPQNSVASFRDSGQIAFTQSMDQHRAGKKTCLESRHKGAITATLTNHPAGRSFKFNPALIETGNTNEFKSLLPTTHEVSSQGPRTSPPEAPQTTYSCAKVMHKQSREGAKSRHHRLSGGARELLRPKNKPLDFQSEDDTGLAAATSEEEIQKHMLRIPAEICQLIMDMVFEEAFGPRTVHPHKDLPVMNIFLALDKNFYRKYHRQYWTKNTWVVSKGPLNETMRFMTEKPYNDATTEFSLQIPNKAALQIRSAEFSFSNADTLDLVEGQRLARQTPSLYTICTGFSPLRNQASHHMRMPQNAQRDAAALQRTQRYSEIQQELIHTWQDKFDRIAMLNLEHLTLDFTEAYDPGGLYLGVHLVRRLIPFAYGVPGVFKILAPDRLTEGQIHDEFLRLNMG